MTPEQQAEQRTREVLQSQPHTRQLVLDSPPGAGKTGVVERLAIQGAWIHGERVMIATQTNGQSFDLAKRLARGWEKYPVYLLTRRGLPVPHDLQIPSVQIIYNLDQLPGGPTVVIANAAKWSYTEPEETFDLMLVDEAYQLRDSSFAQISGFARRHALVGDPGQIAPVVSVPVLRWQHMKDGPHVPAPKALLARQPTTTTRMTLPLSRRLPQDSVQIVQPIFYPGLPFQAVSNQESRKMICNPGNDLPLDLLIDKAVEGGSLVWGQMPAKITGEFDFEAAEEIVGLVQRILERKTVTKDDGKSKEVDGEDIGVVCAHRSQVYAVQERLAARKIEGILVETADRYQGLERKIMIVHHPLSGRSSLSSFQMDTGRFCVMLSRHRIACFVIAREGIKENLEKLSPPTSRILGEEVSSDQQGRQAHLDLICWLEDKERVISLPPRREESKEKDSTEEERADSGLQENS